MDAYWVRITLYGRMKTLEIKWIKKAFEMKGWFLNTKLATYEYPSPISIYGCLRKHEILHTFFSFHINVCLSALICVSTQKKSCTSTCGTGVGGVVDIYSENRYYRSKRQFRFAIVSGHKQPRMVSDVELSHQLCTH